MSVLNRFRQSLAIAVGVALTACGDRGPVAPRAELVRAPELSSLAANADYNATIAELRRVTARYHDVGTAEADGFVRVGDCEDLEGEIPTAIPYAHFDRFDNVINPSEPEALLYEPSKNGRLTLAGVELVIPYATWTGAQPPEFFGVPFQREDEFGVFGLHVWIWRENPDGMFAIANPRLACKLGS
jgi:predicted small lipoprotein YifL